MENNILVGTIAICAIALIIGVLRHKMELLVNLILRMLMGIVGIYIVNELLASINIEPLAGINGITTITIGVLGLPGFLLVYGIGVYYMMFG